MNILDLGALVYKYIDSHITNRTMIFDGFVCMHMRVYTDMAQYVDVWNYLCDCVMAPFCNCRKCVLISMRAHA